MNQHQRKRVIALGFFDGVHLGHSKLLERALEISNKYDLAASVYTFDRHPSSLLTDKSVPLINTTADREYIIRSKYSIDDIIIDSFDDDLMGTHWRSFIHDILVDKYKAGHLVAGWDYRFGHRGEGNVELLRSEALKLGLGCDIVEQVMLNGIPVSSSYIRSLIAEGDMRNAKLFLNHPYLLSGTVIHGKKLGRTLGTPTVNVPFPSELQQLAKGVYATRVYLSGIEGFYQGVTNVGTKPTVTTDKTVAVETYIVNFEGDLYGKEIRLEFLEFIRPEIQFSGLSELKKQVLSDIESVKSLI